MTSGRESTNDARHCWPVTLRVPAGTRLVYLDLNHWIALAKALSGHPDGPRYRDILDQLLHAVEHGQALFPVSLATYVEVMKIGERRRRSDLRRVIERLGRFAVVTSRHVIAIHEIEALLNRLVGPNPSPVNAMDYLDWGVFRALGMGGGVQVLTRDGEDVTSAVRQRFSGGPKEFDRIVNEGIMKLNREILEGPPANDETEFRARGYRPDLILERYVQEAAEEDAWARLLDQHPKWRRGRLRDAVSAREVAFHINSIVKEAASARGVVAFEDIFRGVEDPRRAFDAMPSFDVSVTLKTAMHKNAQHRWANNHVYDIHALASTLPYCDIVLTDREMTGFVRRSKLDERLGTTVLNSLHDLPALL